MGRTHRDDAVVVGVLTCGSQGGFLNNDMFEAIPCLKNLEGVVLNLFMFFFFFFLKLYSIIVCDFCLGW